MTTTRTETALNRFVRDTRALFARESETEKRWTQLTPIMANFLHDEQVIAASQKWPDCVFRDNRPENLLFYEDPDYKFVINGLVYNASGVGTLTPIHDHAHTWTLYGLLDGHQRIERYERIDDGSKKDHAELRKAFDSECGPGEIDLVRPYEIHSEDTLGQRSVALIIRSELTGGFLQGRYIPERNGYEEFYGPRQTRMSLY